ncbi:MAG: transcription termination/antitermination protein NusG [Pelistega sp.]|nr:transcription termination/antitermination protein NusG [Pelistega sp.]
MSMRWYVVHVFSGMEKKVQSSLQERIERAGLQSSFGRILVPTEEVIESRGGQRAVTERRIFPGYVLVEMEFSDEAWHLVKSTNRVTGFLGGTGSRPTPIPEKEVLRLFSQIEEGGEKPRPKILFEVGEVLRIKEGPFADFNGSVEEVNYERNKVRVNVMIFGRATPVELDFSQVEKTI